MSEARHSEYLRRLRTYRTRMLVAVCLTSLGVMSLTWLPIDGGQPRVGWQLAPEEDPMWLLAQSEPVPATGQGAATPNVDIPAPPRDVGKDTPEQPNEGSLKSLPEPQPRRLVGRKAILERAEQQPSIVGGLGSYYIHIEYPEAAIAANIEGRLLLRFVVEEDGVPSNVEVRQSLHPLCDSAAVQALRRTVFAPGRQNGEPVRVRMHLPVLFRLVAPGESRDRESSPDSASADPQS